MLQRIQHWVNCARVDNDAIKIFSNINAARLFSKFKLLPRVTLKPGATFNRASQLYKNISMLCLFPVKRDLLCTNI